MKKIKIIEEFKTFAIKGNMIDMAVGIIIGAAFGKIVSSVVSDLLMPPLGMLLGNVNFTDLKIVMRDAYIDQLGANIPAVTWNYGNFIQTFIDFLIVAICVFFMVKGINKIKSLGEKKKNEEVAKVDTTPVPTKEELLLTEIRDLLKEQNKK